MKISSVDDCQQVLSDAKTGIALRVLDEDMQPLLDALEYMLDRDVEQQKIAELEDELSEAEDELSDMEYKLTNLRDAVEKARGYIPPSSAAFDLLSEALEDSRE